jgi:hypothetical protein
MMMMLGSKVLELSFVGMFLGGDIGSVFSFPMKILSFFKSKNGI